MWRHRDRGMWRHGKAEQVVPHLCGMDKNQEGNFRSKGSQPHTRLPSPGFQCQEDKSP